MANAIERARWEATARVQAQAVARGLAPVAHALDLFAKADHGRLRYWAGGVAKGKVFLLPLEHVRYHEVARELDAARSLARRGLDPLQVLAEDPAQRLSRLFERHVRQTRPSIKFRRLVRDLLFPGWGRIPLRYLRAVDYRSAAAFVDRRWCGKFHARFLRFWAWAAREVPLQPLSELVAELDGLG